jgi:hypothetical protein
LEICIALIIELAVVFDECGYGLVCIEGSELEICHVPLEEVAKVFCDSQT